MRALWGHLEASVAMAAGGEGMAEMVVAWAAWAAGEGVEAAMAAMVALVDQRVELVTTEVVVEVMAAEAVATGAMEVWGGTVMVMVGEEARAAMEAGAVQEVMTGATVVKAAVKVMVAVAAAEGGASVAQEAMAAARAAAA